MLWLVGQTVLQNTKNGGEEAGREARQILGRDTVVAAPSSSSPSPSPPEPQKDGAAPAASGASKGATDVAKEGALRQEEQQQQLPTCLGRIDGCAEGLTRAGFASVCAADGGRDDGG